MDEIDRQIIEILKKDASTPLSTVADMIGIPKPTAYLRFNKMKKEGVIKGFNLVLGKERTGELKTAFLSVKDYLLSGMGERAMEELGKRLSSREEVIFAAKVSRNKVLVIWEGNSFHPLEFKEVVGVEEVEGGIFKSP
ncbi:MAG: AsnC family transcriptional regulator [Candidatus Micrarchaeota archaeon]